MDPYQILGIAPGASEEEVRAAYRRLAQTYNPDNYEAGPLQDQAREKMQQIDAAFDTFIHHKDGAVKVVLHPNGREDAK